MIYPRAESHSLLKQAVRRHKVMSREGLLEKLFERLFRGLVYAQIWEDPEIDMEAMALTPDCHVVAIASGGCNVLSYLTASPARITAVDLSRAHVALNRLKLTAAQRLPSWSDYYRFFGAADSGANPRAYDREIAPHLDAESRAMTYWPFARNPYGTMNVAVRTIGDASQAVTSIVGLVRALDPELAVAGIRTMDEVVSNSVAERRLTMLLLTMAPAV